MLRLQFQAHLQALGVKHYCSLYNTLRVDFFRLHLKVLAIAHPIKTQSPTAAVHYAFILFLADSIAVSVAQFAHRRMKAKLSNNKSQLMWKEAFEA